MEREIKRGDRKRNRERIVWTRERERERREEKERRSDRERD